MLQLFEIAKTCKSGDRFISILNGIDLNISKTEFVAIMGQSGAGKSTLLHIMGLLDLDFDGEYWIDGHLVNGLSETKAAKYRNRFFGFVFQSFNLIPFKTAAENVALPLLYKNVPHRDRAKVASGLLTRVGLKNRRSHYPDQLSGGEQQRVAIARALATQPKVVLADEPTGALDSRTTVEIMDLFGEINRSGVAVVIVTHEKEVAECCDRIIHLKDGVIEKDSNNNV
ncbi:putative ABC transporter, ATP-binding protein [Desulfosarcina variabilis str. Montpellier]|uniref:ABC transporter ATP-binding protein n=1 Tax=Desulfosarcina variabilis TaxID=2300 RepID=UPI003AFAF38A